MKISDFRFQIGERINLSADNYRFRDFALAIAAETEVACARIVAAESAGPRVNASALAGQRHHEFYRIYLATPIFAI
jgi:hypothetical protein